MDTTPDLRTTVLQRLDIWSGLGRRTTASGALQIARVPHVAPLAWLHDVFAPITVAQQEALLKGLPAYATSGLRDIHEAFNGIDLFSSNFFLYGRRANYERSVDNVLPWELVSHNARVSRRLPAGALLVGGSHAVYTGVHFIELSGGPVVALEQENWDNRLFEWPNLRACLLAELDRLSFLFDNEGRPINKAALANFALRRT